MIVRKGDTFNKEDFINELSRRFYSFCSKSPLYINFKIVDTDIIVNNYSYSQENNSKTFKIDFTISEKDNIFAIKQFLVENWYPVITVTQVHMVKPSMYEVQNNLMSGKSSSFIDINSLKEKTVTNTYRIEKVVNTSNQIIVRDMDTKVSKLYQCNIPVTALMLAVYEDPKKASEMFASKCDFDHDLRG